MCKFINFLPYYFTIILVNLFYSEVRAAQTMAQLEKKINTKIKLLQDHCDKDIGQVKTQNLELKNAISQMSDLYSKEIKMLATYIQDQQTEIDTLRDQLTKEDKKIDMIYETEIPVGFVYTELPNQLPPTKLWPNFKWKDITSEYAGLFFRAEGDESYSFGEIQPSNQSWISDVHSVSFYYDSWKGVHGTGTHSFPIAGGGHWSMPINKSNGLLRSISLFTTSGENRPRNTAIRIYQRIS